MNPVSEPLIMQIRISYKELKMTTKIFYRITLLRGTLRSLYIGEDKYEPTAVGGRFLLSD